MILNYKNIKESWAPFFNSNKKLISDIDEFLSDCVNDGVEICPSPELVFRAFESISIEDIKVLIVSQDPYFNGEACGLAFSILPGMKVAPSLKNINKEIFSSLAIDNSLSNGDLTEWSGDVLLLNTSLTTIRGVAGAHKKLWKEFSTRLIEYISNKKDFFVMLSWGLHAHALSNLVSANHSIFKTSHPSPLGCRKSGKNFVSFMGSNCFKLANEALENKGYPVVDWSLPPRA